jgi:osmoprotectant transport system ATP-binding protein
LHKTIVMVTHDVEEAIKVGDLVAVYRPGGHLVQVDTPERLLRAPVDDYVRNFIGFDRGIRRLSFFRTAGLDLDTGAVLPDNASVAEALHAAARAGQSWILVTDSVRKPRGWLSARQLRSLPGPTPLRTVSAEDFGHTFTVGTDSLRAALDAAVLSPAGQGIGADESGRVVGLMSYDRLRASIQAAEAAAAEPGPSKASTASAAALATAAQVQS